MTHSTPSRASATRRRMRIGVVLLGLIAAGGVGSSALWSDTARAQTSVTSGSFGINVDGQQGNPSPYVVDMGLNNFVPGDTATRTFTVTNEGTLPATLSLSISAGVADGLGANLTAKVTRGTTVLVNTRALRGASFANQVVPAGGSVPITVQITAPTTLDARFEGVRQLVTLNFSAVQR